MKKFLVKLHRVLGLIAGLFIFISCLTGAILVFQDEIREWTNSERYFRPEAAGRTALAPSEIVARVGAEHGLDKIGSLSIPADTTRNYIVSLEGKGRAQLYVDPYTGKVVGKTDRKTPDFFAYTMRLHRWLMDDSRTWGKQIMGASTVLFVFILISGIVYWWPKGKKALKARLKVKTDATPHRLWKDMHASLGIYSVCLLLVMALTGLTWSYPWYREGLYAVLGIEMGGGGAPHGAKPEAKPSKPADTVANAEGATEEAQPTFDWDRAYAEVKSKHTSYKDISLEVGKASVGRIVYLGNPRSADSYKLDKTTGEILSFEAYEEQPASNRARGWIYALHTGSWGGIVTKILYFIVCLLGASFPLTGFWLWRKSVQIERMKQNKKAKPATA